MLVSDQWPAVTSFQNISQSLHPAIICIYNIPIALEVIYCLLNVPVINLKPIDISNFVIDR